MNSRFTLTKNTLVQILGKALNSICGLLVIVLVTAEYGQGYGTLVAILSYIGIFYVFTDFGLNAIVVKNIVGEREEEQNYFKNLLGLRLVLSLGVVFAALAILSFTSHPPFVKAGIIVALSLLVFQGLFTSAQALFQAREKFHLSVLSDVLGAFTTLSLVFLTIMVHGSILLLLGSYILGMVVRFVVSSYLVRSQIKTFGASFDIKLWVSLLKAAFPIGLILVFSQINAHLDKQIVFLSDYKDGLNLNGEKAAAVYGLAYWIFETVIVLPAFILNSAYPIMIQKKNEGVAVLLSFARKLSVTMVVLGLVGMFVGLLLAPFAIQILGSGRLNEAVLTSRILFLSFPIFFVTAVTLWLLITLDKRKEVAFVYGLAALFSFVADIYLVPRFGYNAAAFVTVGAEVLILALTSGVLLIALKDLQKQQVEVRQE